MTFKELVIDTAVAFVLALLLLSSVWAKPYKLTAKPHKITHKTWKMPKIERWPK